MVAGGSVPVVALFDLATGRAAGLLSGHGGQVTALARGTATNGGGGGGGIVASAATDGTVRLWDLRARAAARVIQGPLGLDANDAATAVALPRSGPGAQRKDGR